MSNSHQIVHTVAFSSHDAKVRGDGFFTWAMPGDVPRFKAVKIQLGSLEMPLVQYSIEERNHRFYFNEGHRIVPSAREITLRVRPLGGNALDEDAVVRVTLPLTVNNIVKWKQSARVPSGWVATCEHPHGLVSQTGRWTISSMWWGEARIVASPFGYLPLDSERLFYESEYEFGVLVPAIVGEKMAPTGIEDHCGALFVPPPPSPSDLCRLITSCATNKHSGLRLRCDYSASDNRARTTLVTNDVSLQVEIEPTALSQLVGLGSLNRTHTVERNTSFVVETDVLPWWEYVMLQPGWYTPSHRPMSVGQPLRFEKEMEMALNRLYFPMPERVQAGSITAHFLVFVDPCGHTFSVPVPIGMYNPHAFCRLLSDGMTKLAQESTPNVTFDVAYFDERFTFSCEVDTDYGLRPAAFSLLFNHPLQFDPERIGFAPLTYSSQASYTSVRPVHVPNLDPCRSQDAPETEWRAPSNVYRVSEIGHEKRFRIHPIPLPNMTSVILNYNADRSILRVRTHIGILPCAHGLQMDDILTLVPARPGELLVPGEDGWAEATVQPCPLEDSYGRYAIVVASPDIGSDPVSACTLELRVRPTPQLEACTGQTIQLVRSGNVANFCTDRLPHSLTSQQLGYPRGAVQYGVDGIESIVESNKSFPPFDAPHVHCLDPPDYLLIYLDEGKRGTLLQHAYGSSTTTPLAKMVLTPLFRDERMLPRDSTMLSGESLTQFTLRFTNPDGTPYNFKGAHISVSLNLIKTESD